VQNWGYKATSKKLDKHGTLLLLERGFLCRSAHDDVGKAAASVSSVQLGDVIHCYYSGAGKHDPMGAFQVVEKAEAPKVSGHLASQVPGTALYAASDPSFVRELDPEGAYAPDTVLGVLTGWAVKRLGRAKPYDAQAFPGQRTLVRLP
jgi:hypothetical protein